MRPQMTILLIVCIVTVLLSLVEIPLVNTQSGDAEVTRNRNLQPFEESGNADLTRYRNLQTSEQAGNADATRYRNLQSFELASPSTFSLTVEVKNSSGSSIEGATVKAANLTSMTNSSGFVVMRLPYGTHNVNASHPDYSPSSWTVDLDTDKSVTLTLASPYVFQGEIPDSYIIINPVIGGYNVSLLNPFASSHGDVFFEWKQTGAMPVGGSWQNFTIDHLPNLVVVAASRGSPDFPKAWYKYPLPMELVPSTGEEGAFLPEPIPYAAGSIFVIPNPPVYGQNTTIGVTLHNPYDYVLNISRIEFLLSGLTIGGYFSSIGYLSDVSLQANETSSFCINWLATVSGHHCIRVVLTYSPDTQTMGCNINIKDGIAQGGTCEFEFTLVNPYESARDFILKLLKLVPTGWLIDLEVNGKHYDNPSDTITIPDVSPGEELKVRIIIKSTQDKPGAGTVDVEGYIDGKLIGGIRIIIRTIDNNAQSLNIAVIFVEFKDTSPPHRPMSEFLRIAQDLINYYHEISYGSLSLSVKLYLGKDGNWLKLSQNRQCYTADVDKFLQEAIDIADLKGIADFTEYDYAPTNGKGIAICIHPGFCKQDPFLRGSNDLLTQSRIEPQSIGRFSVKVGSITSVDGIVAAEMDEVGLWAHELGHGLAKLLNRTKDGSWWLPDLYSGSEISAGEIGFWGLMGRGNWLPYNWMWHYGFGVHPNHMCSFTKVWLGWLSYVDCPFPYYGSYWIPSLSTMQKDEKVFRYNITRTMFYILEVRNQNSKYSNWDINAPIPQFHESAAVIYKVERKNNRWIANFACALVLNPTPLTGQTDEYRDLANHVKFRVFQERTGSKYEMEIEIHPFSLPPRQIGTIVDPNAQLTGLRSRNTIQGSVPTENCSADLDVHVYSGDGKHVGVNYETGEYEIQIPNATASGDFWNGQEWIFVPENTTVHFVVWAKDTKDFFNMFPELWKISDGIDYFNMSCIYSDSEGNIWQSPLRARQIRPGQDQGFRPEVTENPDGTYTVVLQALPDIEVVSLEYSKTVVGKGYSIFLEVTVENLGDFTETFNVTTYVNTTIIDAFKNITLLSTDSTKITSRWNTTNYGYGNYTISAYATLVPNEIDTDDNMLIYSNILVTIAGDINGDQNVNSADLSILARAYGSTPSQSNWNPNANINDDLIIDAADLFIYGKNHGETELKATQDGRTLSSLLIERNSGKIGSTIAGIITVLALPIFLRRRKRLYKE